MPIPLRHVLACASAVGVIASGCGSGPSGDGGPVTCGEGSPVDDRPLRVATSVAPITSIVADIAGGAGISITGVVPEGVDSHTYEPAPSVAAALADADIVILNGLSLEQRVEELALANLGSGAELCELGDIVLPEARYIFDFSFPEAAGDPNPHLWTNPPMAREYGRLVHDLLTRRDPEHAALYAANLAAFDARVDALDAAMRAATATIPPEQRLLLTYHDAYAYFAEEYGWTVVGAIQPSSFAEPTAREVAALIDQIRSMGVAAVFGSEVFPSPVLEQIAAESGARYVADLRDDDLPGAPGDPEHSWLALMRFNFVTIVEALGGDAKALRALDVGDVGDLAVDAAHYPQ